MSTDAKPTFDARAEAHALIALFDDDWVCSGALHCTNCDSLAAALTAAYEAGQRSGDGYARGLRDARAIVADHAAGHFTTARAALRSIALRLSSAPEGEATRGAGEARRGPAGLDPLPRCGHGGCLLDASGEILEPPCGCRWGAPPAAPREAAVCGIGYNVPFPPPTRGMKVCVCELPRGHRSPCGPKARP